MENLLIKIKRATNKEQQNFEKAFPNLKFNKYYTIEFIGGELDGRSITTTPSCNIEGLIENVKKITLNL